MKIKTKILMTMFVGAALVAVSTAVTVVRAKNGATSEIKNPIAQLLLARFNPNPNMLVEDHVETSCEPEFSVKVFTATALLKATFVIKNAATGAIIFGPKAVSQILPLWQTVALGPMSSIPPKIDVIMTATAPDGKQVKDTLIVEPDCKRPRPALTSTPIILYPIGKILVNPELQNGSDGEPPHIRIPLKPLIMAVPENLLGKSAIVTVKIPDGTVVGQGRIDSIDTEMVSMELTGGGITLPLPPPPPSGTWAIDSFFDITYAIEFQGHLPLTHGVRLINAIPIENGIPQREDDANLPACDATFSNTPCRLPLGYTPSLPETSTPPDTSTSAIATSP